MSETPQFGVYIGRFNPVHVGHTRVIRAMLDEFGLEHTLIVIGSSNAGFSLRHFFSYDERKLFLQKIFPGLRVVGLPDYHNNDMWLAALDDLLELAGISKKNVTFFGGCKEDLFFFEGTGRECRILNRFDGTTVKTSATEVRDALILGRPLEHLVEPAVLDEMKVMFAEKWEQFKKI